MKRLLLGLVGILLLNGLFAQDIPKEKATGNEPIPEKYRIASDILQRLDGTIHVGQERTLYRFLSPDETLVWTVFAKRLKNNRFRLHISCDIYERSKVHIFSMTQPIHPWGSVHPTRIYFTPKDYIKLQGRLKESGKVSLHKCKAGHDCVSDHDRRIYKKVEYTQKFRLRGRESHYLFTGVIDWRADTDSQAGRPYKHEFKLVLKNS